MELAWPALQATRRLAVVFEYIESAALTSATNACEQLDLRSYGTVVFGTYGCESSTSQHEHGELRMRGTEQQRAIC